MTSIALLFGGLLAALSWLAPNHYSPWLSFHAEVLMAAAFLPVFVAEFAASLRTPLRIAPLTAATLLISLVPILQATLGLIHYAGEAVMASCYLLAFALAQLLGARLVQRLGAERLFEGIAWLLLAIAVANVGLQLMQWLSIREFGIFALELASGSAPYANVAQPNQLDTMLFLGLVGTLFLYERGRIGGLVTALLVLLIEGGMVMTASRTAWALMSLLTLFLLLMRRRAGLRLSAAGALALLVAFAALLLLWPWLNDLLLLSQGRSFAAQSRLGPRALLWSTMLDAIAQQPLWGYGWSQGLVAQGRVLERHPADGFLMGHSHDLVLDLMVWNGVPLGLLFTALLLWWFWRQGRACRSAVQCLLLAGVGAVFVHALVEYPLSYLYFLLPVGLMMGALDELAPALRTWQWPAAVPWALGALVAVTGVLIVADYVEVESNVRTLGLEQARVGTHTIESTAPELHVLTQWGDYLRFARIRPKAGMSDAELQHMRQVVERFPYTSAYVLLASAEGLNGQTVLAGQALRRLCLLHDVRRCKDQISAWHELVQEQPALAAVPVPPRP